jgi:NADH-quinone oxidoreductase subunit A
MESGWSQLNLAQAGFAVVGILCLVAAGFAVGILVASHLIGPRRAGRVKQDTYESGMEPVGEARRRFRVGFYLIAVMFLIFDVELVFLYPWAVLFPRLQAEAGSEHYTWAQAMATAGYGPGFMLAAGGIFFGLLLVGFVYEWRRGVFKWN